MTTMDTVQRLRMKADTLIAKRSQGDANKMAASAEPAYAEAVRQLFNAEDQARRNGIHIPVSWIRYKYAAMKTGKNITSSGGQSGVARHKTTDKNTPKPRPVVKIIGPTGKARFEFRD